MFRLFSNSGKRGHRYGGPSPRYEIGGAGPDFGIGVPYKRVWEHRDLPGAGANQWAWETLALPMYTPIGAGTQNKRQFRATASNPVMVAVQGITIVPIGGAPIQGDMIGQFMTQPLMDISQAEGSGIVYNPYLAYATPPNQFEMPTANNG